LISGSQDKKIYCWNIKGTKDTPIFSYSGHRPINALVSLHDKKRTVLCAVSDRTLRFLSIKYQRCYKTKKLKQESVRIMRFVSEKKVLITAGDKGNIKISKLVQNSKKEIRNINTFVMIPS